MAKIDKIDRPTDAAFLLFHFADEVSGITKVQKLLFLIEKETIFGEKFGEYIRFEFKPYKMGPFSPKVYDEVELLLNMGAIRTEKMSRSPSESWEMDNFSTGTGSEGLSNQKFLTTKKGHKIGVELASILDEEVRQDLEETIEDYNQMPLRQLLEYVYTEYENMTSNSEIKGQVLG